MNTMNKQAVEMSRQLKTVYDQRSFIPYARQWIDEDDIQAVVEALHSDWLTTGPKVEEFERAFADFVGSKEAVAVSSGTAALHAAMYALGIGPGDEVIVPPITFAATANCIVFQGGTPVFVDVDSHTLLIDPAQVKAKITPRTKGIIAVDYTGQPCDYDALRSIAKRHNLFLVEDACHALGAQYKGKKVGSLADLTVFSFHPVKQITTGEGGMITTDDHALAERMRLFRNHGITRNSDRFTVHCPPFTETQQTTDNRQRTTVKGPWYYEMQDLGFNCRLTDIQCALGMSQLRKLQGWVTRRQEIARRYDEAFARVAGLVQLAVREYALHAYHLYVIRLDEMYLQRTRSEVFSSLRSKGIGVNVHYIPVHLHPFYIKRFGTGPGLCPIAESAYEDLITLPLFPMMSDQDVEYVIKVVRTDVETYAS
jgi:perosamine synthetase